MIEDLLSNVLNFQDEPDALEGSQSVGTCMIDSKKTINYHINIFSYGCQQGILIYTSLNRDYPLGRICSTSYLLHYAQY